MASVSSPFAWLAVLTSLLAVPAHSTDQTEPASAQLIEIDCQVSGDNRTYRDAVAFERKNQMISAKNLYCAFALLGDDRAQFKYAKLLFASAERSQQDTILATAFAALSYTASTEIKRKTLLDKLSSQLSAEELLLARELSSALYLQFGTGNRRDDFFNLSQQELDELKSKKQLYTGSRIKREDSKMMPLKW